MKGKDPNPARKHPIRVVASRTGLTPDVLRAWEKRYEAVTPDRAGGRRLYSDEDIERLILLRRSTLAGRRIGDIAGLETGTLRELVASDEAAVARAPQAPTGRGLQQSQTGRPREAAEFQDACQQAIQDMNAAALEAALARGRVALSPLTLLDHVVAPVMQRIGDLWAEGRLRVAQEHLASAVVRTFLGEISGGYRAGEDSPRLVVAAPAGQEHELGALLVAVTAASLGWNVTYLGADLPVEEIATVVQTLGARAVALSLLHPADDPRLGGEIERLRRLLGDDVVLIFGGAAAGAYGESIRAARGVLLGDMPSLRALLDSLRSQPAPTT